MSWSDSDKLSSYIKRKKNVNPCLINFNIHTMDLNFYLNNDILTGMSRVRMKH
jgi:hypothetical protein